MVCDQLTYYGDFRSKTGFWSCYEKNKCYDNDGGIIGNLLTTQIYLK